ncbi:MAG TPA: RagB/SusD family nutrient uptake outer membrane protein [Arachidicoccus sp.]|nr:RagB/SusD family nutrient uptake outer membrane protein [Arachidicoccus sp.]
MKKILVLVIVLFSLQSCSKKLDLVNPNAPNPGEFFKTDADARSAVNSVYNSLYYDGQYHRWLILGENFRSDEMYASGPWDQMTTIGSFTQATIWENVGDPYWHAYMGIYRANQVIEGLTDNTEVSESAKDQALGQIYFLRGLYYFNLLKIYRNIPLITAVPKSTAQYTQPLATPEAIWQQIESDWKKAADLLPVNWPSGEAGRATKGAAIAFLGKAYLWEKKYSEAKAQFEQIIDKSPYTYDLMPNYGDNFNETAAANNKESIFEIQWNTKVGGAQPGAQNGDPNAAALLSSEWAMIISPVGFGYGDGKARPWLVDEFLKEKTVTNEEDPRLNLTLLYKRPGEKVYGLDWATGITTADQNSVYIKKYTLWRTKSGYNAALDAKNAMPYYVMRFADVLLMYAETLNELGETTAAYAPINRVRGRAHLADLTTGLTQKAMREQIAHERVTEFCGEGVRFDDLRRWGWLGDPIKLAQLKQHDPEFKTYLPGREYYPQPQNLLNTAGYPQNTGW